MYICMLALFQYKQIGPFSHTLQYVHVQFIIPPCKLCSFVPLMLHYILLENLTFQCCMLQVLLHTKKCMYMYNHAFNHGQITLQTIIVCNVNISFLKIYYLFISLLVASSGSFSPSIMIDLNETDMLVGVTFSINVSQYISLELCVVLMKADNLALIFNNLHLHVMILIWSYV